MRACEREFTQDKAEGVRALVEKLTGQACPCDRGLTCPLFPDAQEELRASPARIQLA